MIVEGKNILLYLLIDSEYVPVGCAKNCTINMQTNFLKITNPNTAHWEEILPHVKSWNISGNGLVNYNKKASSLIFQNNLKDEKKVKIKVQYSEGENKTYIFSGFGYIKSIKQSAPAKGFSSFNYNIIGDGEPTICGNFDEGGDNPPPPEETFTLYWGLFDNEVMASDLPITLTRSKELIKGSDYE